MREFAKWQEWLLIEDAATYLSIVFGEKITEAHVLRLALDGRLPLSVHFVSPAKVKLGTTVRCTQGDIHNALDAGNPHPDLQWSLLSPQAVSPLVVFLPEEAEGEPALAIENFQTADGRYLVFQDKLRTIEGVWDLPMIGGERIDIEDRYQQLTNGLPVDMAAVQGCIVKGSEEQFCQIQEMLDVPEYTRIWKAGLIGLEQYIMDHQIEASKAEALLAQHAEERKKFLELKNSRPNEEFYFPAGRLPKSSRLVVRTHALREFEQMAASNGRVAQKTDILTGTERITALKIIGGWAMEAYRMDIHAERLEGIGEMAKDLERAGAAVTEKTLRQWIKEAAGVIERRKTKP